MLKQYTIFIIVIASLLVFGSTCGTDDESLTVIKLVGKKQSDTTNIVDIVANNCVSAENKEYTCTAGTSSNFSVSLGSEQSLTIGINAIAGGQISLGISEQVAEDLGFNRSSGQTLSFNSPEKGYFTTYGVEERYTVTTGHVQIKSSTGTDREGSYIYRASCELTIIEKETLPCSGNSTTRTPAPKPNEPTWTPTRTPRPALTWTPTKTPRPPSPLSTNTKTPTSQLTPTIPSNMGMIILQGSDNHEGLETQVQWLDGNGSWHNVENWQEQLDNTGRVSWLVWSKDFNAGPFRWVVYNRDGSKRFASQSFYLPGAGQGYLININ